MVKVVVLTLGFEEKFAVRMLVRRGLEPEDKVLLITGPIVEKTRKAISHLREFLRYFEGVELEVFEVKEVYDFVDACSKIISKFMELARKYDEVYVNLSGGMRALILETYTAYLLLPRNLTSKIKVELDTEDSKAVVEVPKEIDKILEVVDLGAKTDIVRVLQEYGEIDLITLSKITNKDETTIRKQLEYLKKLNLIELEHRPLKIKPKKAIKLILIKH